MIKQEKNIKHWLASSEKDFDVAKGLYKLKHYTSMLVFLPFELGKIIKGDRCKKN